jgi:hypothetical protein
MAATESRREAFNFGGVFTRAFGAIGRNAGAFLLLAVPLCGFLSSFWALRGAP